METWQLYFSIIISLAYLHIRAHEYATAEAPENENC